MAHGVVCHFDLPHMAQKVADWTRREGRPRADEMAHGAVCRFELPHVAENNRRVTRVDSSLWPQRTVPKLPSGTNGCQTLKTATLNTSYFCQKRPLCQPPPSPTPPPNSHFVRKVKLRLAYRLAFVITVQNPKSKIPKIGQKSLDFGFWIGEFWILDFGPKIQNPKSPRSKIQNPKSPKSKIQNPQNPKSKIRNPQDPKSKIPKIPKIQNLPPKSKIWGVGGLTERFAT